MSPRKISSMAALIGGLIFSFYINANACGVNWRMPLNHFDGVNEQGVVAYWQQLGTIDLGNNFKLPLIIGFHSDQAWSSLYLGRGWIFPLFESNIVQLDENTFRQIQPDGYNVYFGRDGKDRNLLHGQKGWAGQIKGDVITLYATCGWKLVYKQGKLISICTPDGNELKLVYNEGRVVELQDQMKAILQVGLDPIKGVVNSLTYGRNKINIELGAKPRIESLGGRNVVGAMEGSLVKLSMSDGKIYNYDFSVNSQLQPILKIENNSNSTPRTIVWDPRSKRIISDDGWTYNIAFPHPNLNAKIERSNNNGQKELWYFDSTQGSEITTSIDGVETRKQWFLNGPSSGKLRDVYKQDCHGKYEHVKYAYDEDGRIVRMLTEKGTEGSPKKDDIAKVFSYDHGKLQKIVESGTDGSSQLYPSTFDERLENRRIVINESNTIQRSIYKNGKITFRNVRVGGKAYEIHYSASGKPNVYSCIDGLWLSKSNEIAEILKSVKGNNIYENN